MALTDRIPLDQAPAISGISAPSFDRMGSLDVPNDSGMTATILVVPENKSQAAPATGSSEVADH